MEVKENKKIKVIRTATVSLSLNVLLKGQLKYQNAFYTVKAVSSDGEDLSEVRSREGIDVESISMERRIAPLRDLVSLFKLYRLFKREKPSIVHSITPKAGLLTALAGRMAKVPIRIHTFTGLIFPYRTGLFQKILIFTDRILCASATHIFPEGQGVKRDLLQYKITNKPLEVIANGNVNGIDLSYYDRKHFSDAVILEEKQKLGIQANDFVFLFVGRVVKEKGIEELVNAFVQLKGPEAKLLIVGPFEQELDPINEAITDQIGNNTNIIHVGFQKDVRPFLQMSNALAFPSYREGFPNVVIQAGAYGLPSIVTDISGSNEIIQSGVNGIIIEKKQVDPLVRAMYTLINDRINAKHLGDMASNLVRERYANTLVWEALVNKYDLLLKEKGLVS